MSGSFRRCSPVRLSIDQSKKLHFLGSCSGSSADETQNSSPCLLFDGIGHGAPGSRGGLVLVHACHLLGPQFAFTGDFKRSIACVDRTAWAVQDEEAIAADGHVEGVAGVLQGT